MHDSKCMICIEKTSLFKSINMARDITLQVLSTSHKRDNSSSSNINIAEDMTLQHYQHGSRHQHEQPLFSKASQPSRLYSITPRPHAEKNAWSADHCVCTYLCAMLMCACTYVCACFLALVCFHRACVSVLRFDHANNPPLMANGAAHHTLAQQPVCRNTCPSSQLAELCVCPHVCRIGLTILALTVRYALRRRSLLVEHLAG